MAAKKRKSNPFLKIFIGFMVLLALGGMGWIGYVWWNSRQVEFVRYPQFGIALPARYSIHGIDVSRYQQLISWESVAAMEVNNIRLSFAFIKATEGNGNVDPYFRRNWKRAKTAGIVRGAYHFFIPSKDGKKQAQNFIKQVTLESGDLPPVLDVEQAGGVPAERLRREVKIWLDVLEAFYGVKPVIYTNVAFYKRYLNGFFDDYPLWVAHYLEAHRPRIARDWVLWQHSEQGRVNGIRARVDFNVFNGDSVQFRSFLVP